MEIAYYTIFIFSASPLRIAVCEEKSAETKNILQAQQFSGQHNDAF
jgi:hypothetical protein